MNEIHELVDFVMLACEADMIVTSEFPWLIDLESIRLRTRSRVETLPSFS